MSEDIVERLGSLAREYEYRGWWTDRQTAREAAARIAALEAEVADLRLAVRTERDDGTEAANDAYARGFAAAREAAAAALSRLTAQWPHVGPVPPTVRGEWALRAKALPAIRALRPEEPGA